MKLLLIVPLFEDWACLSPLARELAEVLRVLGATADLLIVDDASVSAPPEGLAGKLAEVFGRVTRLELARNLGHQRAIAMGLAHAASQPEVFDAVVVMDADGEDRPAELPRLIAEFHSRSGREAVFARRSRRSEGIGFRFFYRLYRLAYRLMTGRSIFVGNYCVLPHEFLPRLALVSELWMHFASGLIRARIPWTAVDTERGKRYDGSSRMNFPSLVLHGLSAIAVHSDWVGIRALLFTAIASVGLVIGIAVVIGIKFLTPLAIPGWASTVVGLSVVILVQMVMSALLFAFVVIGRQNALSFTPLRNYQLLILRSGPLA